MKRFLKYSLISALSIISASFLILNHTSNVKEVNAYDTSSLPTTIDLNDCTDNEIRSYYSSLNSLDEDERGGTNLLKNLKDVLSNGQKYYSYDVSNGLNVWRIYEITDRDWERSPASSTRYGTYDPDDNIIYNYSYGSSASYSRNNPYIHALYFNRERVTNTITAWDNHQQDETGFNREHVWPKSLGFESESAGGARGDPMHLMAGMGYSNKVHSNYYYGYVDTSSSYTDCGDTYGNQYNNLLGYSVNIVSSNQVFEPQDSDKGDIARAIFYMAARYNYLSGSDDYGIDADNPNLEIVQNLSSWRMKGYDSTTTNTGKIGILTDLLAWHHADPVDDYEIHRNNLLFKNYTNNRNPFIDFPEWADIIWGDVEYDGKTLLSHSSPTGYASPITDKINDFADDEEVSLTASVEKSFYVGETITKDDITVVDNKDNVITDFDFEAYTFKYEDSLGGGANKTKEFTVTYSGTDTKYAGCAAIFTVNVSREAYSNVSNIEDSLDADFIGVTSNRYSSWEKTSSLGVSYAGNTNYSTNYYCLGIRATNNSGLVITSSIGNVSKVKVEWNSNAYDGRTLNLYGKNTPYESATDLYSDDTKGEFLGSIVKGTSTELVITASYLYIGTNSNYSTCMLDSITFVFGGNTAKNVANYIMYEDTTNQCVNKYEIAKGYFNSLSDSQKTTFMESDDYVISKARDRFVAWALYHGESIITDGNSYTLAFVGFNQTVTNHANTITIIVISVIALLSVSSIAVILVIKRRKHI